MTLVDDRHSVVTAPDNEPVVIQSFQRGQIFGPGELQHDLLDGRRDEPSVSGNARQGARGATRNELVMDEVQVGRV